MKVQAAEQMFDTGSFLLWMNAHGGLIFLVSDKGFWRGWPDEWSGELVDPNLAGLEPSVERGFAYLIERANLLPIIGLPIEKEHPYQSVCEERADGWVLTDFYGRKIELRQNGTWHVASWPASAKAEWV